MTALAERPVSVLVGLLATLRSYHRAAASRAPDRIYDDDHGPLARSIGAIKAELATRLGGLDDEE